MTDSFNPGGISYVASIEQVRSRHPRPMTRATGKVLRRLDKHCRAILERCTFCVIGTQGPGGSDVSPRGDPPGFVRVLSDRHLLLPDRIGNNRFDSYDNIFSNPKVGLLFLVPGMAEVLRINGAARVTDDAALLAGSMVQGRAPQLGLLIEVEEAYLHCAKAINRAALWDPSRHIDRSELPSYGDMLVDHVAGLTREESQRQGEEMARRGMY
ncbi:MAG TPA: MSMEG_1061 family FMN-dependent PPOX-type flavoprotein [Hyphomicrobiaceae bacterium]|nr:MSMEG_1061 family FMN-dependent PPOX-type flavoprotein [Hyphomicrobiaceae bacterium]